MAIKGEKLRAVYGVFFAVFTLLVGGLFIAQVWSIYRSAPTSPYTVESISKHFKQIAIPVWLWVAGLAVNIALAIVYPEKQARIKATVDERRSMQRAKEKIPTEGEFFAQASAISKRSTRARTVATWLTVAFMTVAAAFSLLTLFDVFYLPVITREFFAAGNGLVDKITQTAILSVAVLAVTSVACVWIARSYKREQKEYLAILVESKRAGVTGKKEATKEEKSSKGWKSSTIFYARIAIATVGVTLIVIGVCNGGMRDVLQKAINICTQCIGLG